MFTSMFPEESKRVCLEAVCMRGGGGEGIANGGRMEAKPTLSLCKTDEILPSSGIQWY